MRAAVHIAAKDLRQRLRDRSALVLGFVAPLVIAALMSAAFSGTEDFHVAVGVVDEDHAEISAAFLDVLESPDLADILSVERLDDEQAALAAVDDGDVDAAYVVPEGFSAAAQGGEPVPVSVLTSVDAELGGEVARAIAEGFAAQINAIRLSVTAATASGVELDDGLVARAQAQAQLETVVERAIGSKQLRAISYYAPGMAIFFAFFAIGFTARSFFSEQREGTLDRIAAAPVAASAVLVGKVLATAVYVTASLATMWLVTSLVFDADWGPPPAAAAIGLAMVIAVVCVTALVITVSRTQRQAEAFSSVAVFTLALLGGNFIFVSSAPEAMRRLALLTPNGWALRAYTDFATGAAGLENVVPPLLGIAGFSAATGALAVIASRRLVTR